MAYKFSESKPSCGCKVWKERKKKIINNRKIAYMEDNTLFALWQQQIRVFLLLRCHIFYQQDCQDDSSFGSFCLLLSQEKTLESLGSLTGKENFLNLCKNREGYGLKHSFWIIEENCSPFYCLFQSIRSCDLPIKPSYGDILQSVWSFTSGIFLALYEVPPANRTYRLYPCK